MRKSKKPGVPRPPGFELFMAPLQVTLDTMDCESVGCAYLLSKYAHAKQTRDGGSRYFDHPKRAALIYINELHGRNPRVIIDLLLHDVLEDTYLLSLGRFKLNFGEEIALDIRALTKLPKGKETTREYLLRNIERGPWTVLSKLCDRLDNLRTLDGCTQEKRVRTIKETKRYHVRLLIPALRSHGGEWAAYADILKKKIADAIAVCEQTL